MMFSDKVVTHVLKRLTSGVSLIKTFLYLCTEFLTYSFDWLSSINTMILVSVSFASD